MSKFNVPVKRESETVDAYQERLKNFVGKMTDNEVFDYIKNCFESNEEEGKGYENCN